jgi:hypothetical protein
MVEKRAIRLFVGDADPDDTPEEDVSERFMNDFSIKSLFVLYINQFSNACASIMKRNEKYGKNGLA